MAFFILGERVLSQQIVPHSDWREKYESNCSEEITLSSACVVMKARETAQLLDDMHTIWDIWL